MQVLVIGLGSMGKRRIRLLKQVNASFNIIGVDMILARRMEAEKQYGINTEERLEDAIMSKCDCAFICTSPLSHAVLIEKCLKQGLHVFTEINLTDDKYDDNMKLAEEKKVVLFLSSTFLYREEIKYIRQEVNKSKSLLSYVYHVGQYLPDWHPWESYTEYFVKDAKTNGCRELMAIELPWLYKTFGKINNIQVKKGKKTGLTINYNDSYLLMVEHENGVQGLIAVDVVSRKPVRNLEIYGEDLYISWDGTAEGLKQYDLYLKEEQQIVLYNNINHESGYAPFVVENAYKSEIQAFINKIEFGIKEEYGYKEDMEILRIIDEIEKID